MPKSSNITRTNVNTSSLIVHFQYESLCFSLFVASHTPHNNYAMQVCCTVVQIRFSWIVRTMPLYSGARFVFLNPNKEPSIYLLLVLLLLLHFMFHFFLLPLLWYGTFEGKSGNGGGSGDTNSGDVEAQKKQSSCFGDMFYCLYFFQRVIFTRYLALNNKV